MKAILTKNIKVKTATAYLVFEKEQNRPDVVKFLNGEEFEDDTINTRVKEYLLKLHILDRDGSLTQKGNKVIETGKIFVQEEGKYKIWFTENDNFINTKILYFERKSPRDREKINEINIDFEKENYFLPLNNKEFSLLNLVNTDNISGQINGNTESIKLIWKWKDLDNSNFHFTGKIDKKSIKEHKIESKVNLEEYILKIFPDWDYINQKLKVEFRNLTTENEKRNFKTNYSNTNQTGFNNIEFTDIPIIPYDNQDAKKWRNWFIKQEIENEYYLKYDFEKLVNEINSKNGFSVYKNNLDIPEISEYREEIYNKDRSKQNIAFWHLSAPNDLNPDADQKYIIKSLNYEIGKNISFANIVNKLVENSNNEINTVFYYDKYTYTNSQQKSMTAFFNTFDRIEDKSKYLITIKNLNGKKRSNYLTQDSKIEVIDANNIFHSKLPHNRYIILAENKEKYTVWQLPSSIDYIKFQDNEIEPETIGEIKDSISFNQVNKEMLKQQLRTFIENKL
jgi:hypothetical protein